MDFYVRQLEGLWLAARERLARFVGCDAAGLVFVDNATVGMNIVAGAFPLSPGDEVLLTNHEYGAVMRIWERACAAAGAQVKTVALPQPFTTAEETVDAVLRAVTSRTKLLVVSHITSPTAVILPVQALCDALRERGVAVCIDGPHAPLQVEVNIHRLGCDFYTASCHKWLSAPLGSGFLAVAPQWRERIRPPVLSWGRLPPNQPRGWWEEFVWSGTRDYSPFLAIPAAIDFFERLGLDAVRSRLHELARYARHQLQDLTDLSPLVPDRREWYGSMAHLPLPPGTRQPLQDELWRRARIEVPIVEWNGGRWIRVSTHLYNTREQVDLLCRELRMLLDEGCEPTD